MPDFTMCKTAKCPLAKSCKRNEESGTVVGQPLQSWGWFEPNENGECAYFEPIKDKSN